MNLSFVLLELDSNHNDKKMIMEKQKQIGRLEEEDCILADDKEKETKNGLILCCSFSDHRKFKSHT